ncbi:MAG TPA: hypothetical protein VET26_02835, partial [Candidatus Sulfotelmatobacter sp.]|nr:hypothetical protein [Candidatus Sulfotelmatobacter sp.]
RGRNKPAEPRMVGMRRLALVALFALSCGALPAHAQTLSLSYKAGDTYRYGIHTALLETLTAGVLSIPIDIEITAHETVKVTAVDAAGISDLTITISDTSVKTVSKGVTSTTTGLPDTSTEMKVASDGRVQSVNGNSTAGNPFTMLTNLGGGFISAVLPDKPVKPGDTWTKTYDQTPAGGTGSVHVVARSRYLRDESVSGVSTAAVETNSTATILITTGQGALKPVIGSSGSPASGLPTGDFQSVTIKGTVVSDVTSWIDPGAHRVVKSHESSATDATMMMTMAIAPGTSPLPALGGTFASKGTETIDMTPA